MAMEGCVSMPGTWTNQGGGESDPNDITEVILLEIDLIQDVVKD